MAYPGLTPSEGSTGESVKQVASLRLATPVHDGFSSRPRGATDFPPRASKDMQARIGVAPRAACEIAWKADAAPWALPDTDATGKRPTIAVTAIARELSAFIWAINREVAGSHATAN